MDYGSGIRVEVAFENPAVFAGDELIAVITFKNVSKSTATEFNTNTFPPASRQSVSIEEQYYTPTARLAALDAGGIAPNELNSNNLMEHRPTDTSNDHSTSQRRPSISNGISEMYNGTLRDPALSSLSVSRIRSSHGRRESVSGQSEQLLMGFVQLQGYFKMDNEIIDAGLFEHIKRQGVVVGKNGIEYGGSTKDNVGGATKFLNDLASGFGGLLTIGLESPSIKSGGAGAGTLAPIPESPSRHGTNRVVIKSDSDDHMGYDDFPIFSTPQSLLFVDLKLQSGESHSYCYKIKLPRKLPPSYRGKALRIHYNLVIGIQRAMDPQASPIPKLAFFPFRVFPYVDGDGGQSTYNFEKPIVLRQDNAIVKPLSGRRASSKSFEWLREANMSVVKDTEAARLAKSDFISYVDKLMDPNTLLSQEAVNLPVNFALLQKRSEIKFDPSQDSPNPSMSFEGSVKGDDSAAPGGYSARENIDFYFQYKYAQKDLKRNFDLAKNGKFVATISLSKPAYRVGEEIIVGLDFSSSESQYACHHLTASLETIETVDESVLKNTALSQGHRIYSQKFISTFLRDKLYLELSIPPTSSPQFSTTILSLAWSLKLDFILTQKNQDSSCPLISNEAIKDPNNDKSAFFVANEKIPCEPLSCRITLNVLPTNQDIGAIIDHSLQRRRCLI